MSDDPPVVRFEPPSAPRPDAGLDGADALGQACLAKSSAVVAVGTALSRATGFVRIAAIAYALGVSALAGTYSYANETPNIVYELLVGGVLTATLVPVFVRHFEKRDDEAPSAIMTVSVLVLVAVTVFGVVLAPAIVRLYTIDVHGPGRAEQQQLATELLRLFMPQIVFYGITALATAMLNASGAMPRLRSHRSSTTSWSRRCSSVSRVASGSLTVHNVLADDALVVLIGLGTTAGVAAMALALVPPLLRSSVRLRFLPAWRHPAVRTILRLSGWTVGYVVANQVALFVVTVLANGTCGGPFVYMGAYAFFQLPFGLFTVSLMTTFTPELARAAARDDTVALRAQLARALRLTTAVIIPMTALYIALGARPTIVTLFQRGAFSSGDAAIVSDTLVAFAVGLLPFSVYLFALRAFYSRLDTYTPFWINCVENACNVALAFPLYAWLGIPGLALAFATSYAIASVLVLAVLHRRLGSIEAGPLVITLAKTGAAALAAGVVAWSIAEAIGWSSTSSAFVSLLLGGVAGLVTYLVGAHMLQVTELGALFELVPGRRRAAPVEPGAPHEQSDAGPPSVV